MRIGELFVQFGNILCICPCCDEIFRLSDGRPFMKHRRLRTPMDALEAEARRIERRAEQLEASERSLREMARSIGQRRAKKQLKEIDPIFCGNGLDPQDAKALFNPIDYIVFHGMNNKDVRKILLLSRLPHNKASERFQTSLRRVIQRGKFEFKTLRVEMDGALRMT